MVSSACLVLQDEPDRFINYLFSDPKLREKLVDKASFVEALERVLNSDPSLSNIPVEIGRKGESLEMCGQHIFDHPSIQSIIKGNIAKKKVEIQGRVRTSHPSWSRTQRQQEVQRRMNIFIKTSSQKIQQSKQVTIDDSLRPVKVKDYVRGGQRVKGVQKTKYRELTMQEQMLMENGINKGKKPSEIIKDYLQAGLPYRTETSIRRHYYRIKGKSP